LSLEFEKVIKWLGAIDYWLQHREINKTRTPGTGSWFLGGNAYSDWKTSKRGRLWVTAMGT